MEKERWVRIMPDCINCPIRKFYAKHFGIYFTYENCIIKCKQKRKSHKQLKKLGNGKIPEYER